MLNDGFTLQCRCCGGYFSVVAVPGSTVCCPHCGMVAATNGFFPVPKGETAASAVELFHDDGLAGQAGCTLDGHCMQFECPYCRRGMKMLTKEAGALADCPHCGLEIVSPQPEHGYGPRLTRASRRQLGNLLYLQPDVQDGGPDRGLYSRTKHPGKEARLPGAASLSAGFPDFLSDTPASDMPVGSRAFPDPVQEEASFRIAEPMAVPDQQVDPADAHDDDQGRGFTIAACLILLFLGGLFIALELLRTQQAEDAAIPSRERSMGNWEVKP